MNSTATAHSSQVWLVTGAGSGIGAEIVRAALAAGHHVVATGRSRAKVESAYREEPRAPLVLEMDVTDDASVRAAVNEADTAFGRIDVLVNNAGRGLLGHFESISSDQARAQFETNVFGLMSVTRAVLPVMRRERRGHIVNISSVAGIRGSAGSTIYAASKFAVEGFSEALAQEVREFNIGVSLVEPGLFSTNFMEEESITFGEFDIPDYGSSAETLNERYRTIGRGAGKDPARLGRLVVELLARSDPPSRFPAGADALHTVESKAQILMSDAAKWRELALSLEPVDHETVG